MPLGGFLWEKRISGCTCSPPRAYKCLCIIRSIVGTLFPLESNESCIDSVDTPKTLVLHMKDLKSGTLIEIILKITKMGY